MTVAEALAARRSFRDYKPDPVPKDVLTEILTAAARTPSWANSQPWDVFVAAGQPLENIRSAFAEAYRAARPVALDVARPAQWTAAAQARTRGLHPDMLRDCGDDASRFGALNNAMFNAPCVIYLCVDKMLAHWALYDLGAYAQSLMLAAIERDLGTIPAINLVNYPDIVKKELAIPDNFNLALGLAIGYVDWDKKINNFHSSRDTLENTVRFFGM